MKKVYYLLKSQFECLIVGTGLIDKAIVSVNLNVMQY